MLLSVTFHDYSTESYENVKTLHNIEHKNNLIAFTIEFNDDSLFIISYARSFLVTGD